MKMLKISDGDLVIITHGQFQSGRAHVMITAVQKWVDKRGLEDVTVVTSDSGPKDSEPTIVILTVNNVFDNEVL